MFGLTKREVRFGLILSSSHYAQHFLSRLFPPLIPILAIAFSYPLWKLGLLLTAYSLGSGLAQAPLGIASDRYDRVLILPTGIGLAGAGYILFAAAPTLGVFLPSIALFGVSFDGMYFIMALAMSIVGIGTAVTHPVGYPMITDNVSPDNKGKVLGMWGSLSKFGDATAPTVIAILILVTVWENILFLLGTLGIIYSIGLFWVLADDKYKTIPAAVENAKQNDDPESTDDNSESVWRGDKRKYVYPMAIMYIFFITNKFSSNGIKAFFPAFIVSVYAFSFNIMDVTVGPESVANLYFSGLFLIGGIAQLLIGGFTDILEPRTVLITCLSGATLGILALALLNLSPIFLLLVLLVLGVGFWGLNPARDALISDISPPEREGRTFGYIWTAVQISGSGIPFIIGVLIDFAGMRDAFLVLAIGTMLAAGAISLLYLDRVYKPVSPSRSVPDTSD